LLIHGLAGLGKSETALEFAKRHVERFSLIWHIPSEDSILYDEAYRLLAKTLNIPFDKESPDVIRRKVHFYLENVQDEKPWLLIFDNVENELPIPARGGVVLITSRQEHLGALQASRLDIQPFDKEESKEFLLKYLNADQLDDVDGLHRALEGWPLLLTQVAMYLKGRSDKVSQYLAELEGINPIFTRDEQVHYPRSLAQAFDLTLQKVEQRSAEALDLLYCCAFLNPDQIDSELFQRWMGRAPLQWKRNCLVPLSDLSIIKLIQGKTGFSMHRLWQFFLRKKLKEKGDANAFFVRIVELLYLEAQAFDYSKLQTWNQWKVCVSHVGISGDYWDQLAVEKRSYLLTQVGLFFLNVNGSAKNASIYFQEALEIRKRALGEDHSDTATSYNNMGMSLSDLDQHEKALEYFQKALEIRKRVLGEDHPDTATSYNNMGMSLSDLDQHEKALEYFQKALEIRKRVLGEDHPDTATSYYNVGISLRDLGRYEEALEYKQKAHAIRRKLLGEDHPDTGKSYNNVGSSLRDLGRHEEALEYKQKGLEIRKKALGDKHPDLAINYNDVGSSLRDLGCHEGALEYFQKALEIRRKALGEEHSVTGTSYNNVSSSYSDLGRYEEALTNSRRALEIRRKALGEEHSVTGTSYNNVGMCFRDLGRHDKALKYQKKALEICKKKLGEDHPDTSTSYNNVGMSFNYLGRHEEALESLQKALEIRKKALGENHPLTLESTKNVEDCKLKLSIQSSQTQENTPLSNDEEIHVDLD
jgi:tetratricopeptide (TPR) repeat protein